MKNQTQTDIVSEFFSMSFIDKFHDYRDLFSNIRLYHFQKASAVRDFLDDYHGEGKILLDAGAGRGPYVHLALGKFSKIYCFEYSLEELNKAKENLSGHQSVEFGQVDLTSIPLDNNSVDHIVCSEVLEHIPGQDTALKELYRVMKPGGVGLFSMPNKHSLFYFNAKRIYCEVLSKEEHELSFKEWEFVQHLKFDYKEIEELIVGAGFSIIKRQGVNVLPIPYKVRKFFMSFTPRIFSLYMRLNNWLSEICPSLGSFYFLTIKK